MLLQAVNQGQGSGMPVMDRVIQRSEGAVQDDNHKIPYNEVVTFRCLSNEKQLPKKRSSFNAV